MIRVRIYEPELKRVKKKGEKNTKTVIVNKKGKFISERAVMDRTYNSMTELEGADQDEWIINHKRYFEKVDMSEAALEKRSKEELVDLGKKAGMKNAGKEDKKSLVQKIADYFKPTEEKTDDSED